MAVDKYTCEFCPACGSRRLSRISWDDVADLFKSQKTVDDFASCAALTREQVVAGAVPVPERTIQTGVYFLLKGDQIVYVGKAELSVSQRVAQHAQEKDFDRVSFLPIKRGRHDLIRAAEAFFIQLFDPPLNKIGGSRKAFRIVEAAHAREVKSASERKA